MKEMTEQEREEALAKMGLSPQQADSLANKFMLTGLLHIVTGLFIVMSFAANFLLRNHLQSQHPQLMRSNRKS